MNIDSISGKSERKSWMEGRREERREGGGMGVEKTDGDIQA